MGIEHEGEGGEPAPEEDGEVADVPPSEDEVPPFNCDVDDDDIERKWSQLKKEWCCGEHEKGCDEADNCDCSWADNEGACDDDDGTPCHQVCCAGKGSEPV